MIRAILPWVVVGLLIGPPTARAQSSADEQARIHFQAGTNYFTIADYEAALREYERAYELAGRPALLHNIYLCHERLGNLEESIEYLERYLASGAEVQRRDMLEQRLANMRARLETQQDQSPSEPPPPLEHGEPITRDDVIDTGTVDDGDAPATGEPKLDDAPPAAQPEGSTIPTEPSDDEPPSGGLNVPAVVSFVIAGVGLGSFAVFGGMALAEDSSLENRCVEGCSSGQVDRLRGLMIGADASLAIGAAAGIAGVVFLLTGGQDAVEREVADVSPWLGPEGGGLRGRVAF